MAKCKACGAEIKWVNVASGKAMPCNVKPLTVVVPKTGEVVRAYESHFPTCPEADKFRNKKKKRNKMTQMDKIYKIDKMVPLDGLSVIANELFDFYREHEDYTGLFQIFEEGRLTVLLIPKCKEQQLKELLVSLYNKAKDFDVLQG